MNIYFNSISLVVSKLKEGESLPLSKLTSSIDRSLNINKILNELDIMSRKGYIQIDIQSNITVTEVGYKLFHLQ